MYPPAKGRVSVCLVFVIACKYALEGEIGTRASTVGNSARASWIHHRKSRDWHSALMASMNVMASSVDLTLLGVMGET